MRTFFSILFFLVLTLPFCKAQEPAGTHWKKIDFYMDRQVMDVYENRNRYKDEGSEECPFACRYVPQLKIENLWVSVDRKKYKARLTYEILENYDTADVRNYHYAEGFDEFYKHALEHGTWKGHAWKKKIIEGKLYIFKYLVQVPDDYVQKGYVYDKRKLDKTVLITRGRDTMAAILPGQIFELEGQLDVQAGDIYVDSVLRLRFNTTYLATDEALDYFPIHNRHSIPPQNNRVPFANSHQEQLKNYPEQYLFDEIVYQGKDSLVIKSISSPVRGVRMEIKKKWAQKHNQVFELCTWVPSSLVLKHKKMEVPVKIIFTDGRKFEFTYHLENWLGQDNWPPN